MQGGTTSSESTGCGSGEHSTDWKTAFMAVRADESSLSSISSRGLFCHTKLTSSTLQPWPCRNRGSVVLHLHVQVCIANQPQEVGTTLGSRVCLPDLQGYR